MSTAFPVIAPDGGLGLTKREYAAIHIMAAIIGSHYHLPADIAAESTVTYVDALFLKLNAE